MWIKIKSPATPLNFEAPSLEVSSWLGIERRLPNYHLSWKKAASNSKCKTFSLILLWKSINSLFCGFKEQGHVRTFRVCLWRGPSTSALCLKMANGQFALFAYCTCNICLAALTFFWGFSYIVIYKSAVAFILRQKFLLTPLVLDWLEKLLCGPLVFKNNLVLTYRAVIPK